MMRVSALVVADRSRDSAQASLLKVVLPDLSPSGRDGLDVLVNARADGLTVPVIILTARAWWATASWG